MVVIFAVLSMCVLPERKYMLCVFGGLCSGLWWFVLVCDGLLWFAVFSDTPYCLPKRPRQTVQTQFRLLLKKQSELGLTCLLF